ncbi:MAG: protein kinase [Chloroflexota bacterium]|nr:MAG: protein kinase [Chloroflexota bacterium]
MLEPGTILQNRYRIVSTLGQQGGMSVVYRAWHLSLKVPVAVKEFVIQTRASADLARGYDQFQEEALTLAKLNHPNLVDVLDYFEAAGKLYLVMRFVEGESLHELIAREGAISEAQVLVWAGQLLDALAYCHSRQVIHRDIKPPNIIIKPDGQAVLVDFGLVKMWDPADPITRTIVLGMGTPEYAPPEQYEMEPGHTGPWSDIYSLGATLYHALTGQAPTSASRRMATPRTFKPPRQLSSQVSAQTEAVVLQAMAMERASRFPDAASMAAALREQKRPFPVSPIVGLIPLLIIAVGVAVWWLFEGAGTASVPTSTTALAGNSTTTPTVTLTLAPTATSTPAASPTPTASPTATETPSPESTSLPSNLAGLASNSASDQAGSGVDTCGNSTSYSPRNLTDGVNETAWRVIGDGQGATIQLMFDREITLSSFNIMPGYAKRDPCDRSINWCLKNRIPQRILLTGSDGERQELELVNDCSWQSFEVNHWRTNWLEIRILSSYPRKEEHRTDFTAISEIQVFGW